jgi:hypothetical protein
MQPKQAGGLSRRSTGSEASSSTAGSSSEEGSTSRQQQQFNEQGTLLCYSLYVQPQAWLPVALIQNRIEKEVAKNLEAVRAHAEYLHTRQQTLRAAM